MRRLYVLFLFVALGLFMAGPGHAKTLAEKVGATRYAQAEQGDAVAQCWIGRVGRSIGAYEEALYWLTKAAEQGHAEAQKEIGEMYESGEGVQRSFEQAFTWFLKAAESGSRNARVFQIGRAYEKGSLFTTKDITQAYMWYNLAATQKAYRGEYTKYATERRDNLAKTLTPAQIEEGERLTREWIAARPGSQEAAQICE